MKTVGAVKVTGGAAKAGGITQAAYEIYQCGVEFLGNYNLDSARPIR